MQTYSFTTCTSLEFRDIRVESLSTFYTITFCCTAFKISVKEVTFDVNLK